MIKVVIEYSSIFEAENCLSPITALEAYAEPCQTSKMKHFTKECQLA